MTFCNRNHIKENSRCRVLVAYNVQGCQWFLQIMWCMSAHWGVGYTEFGWTNHNSSKGTIYELTTWFCGTNKNGKHVYIEQVYIGGHK